MKPVRDDDEVVAFGRFQVSRRRRELLADGFSVELGSRAFEVLMALIDARGTILSKDDLMHHAWPGRIVEENNLQAQISALRRAFGPDRSLIRTIAGRGYQFVGDVRATDATTLGAGISTSPRPLTNLPQPVSDLIGRNAELDSVTDLLISHRLVALVGAGGVGKTRLALEVARRLLPQFPDGVWIAALASLSDPELVPSAVAAAFGLEFAAASPEPVATALRSRKALLILDNCEHVIDAAAHMAEALLRACPSVSVIATSRERLRAEGECVYRVPPLDVPRGDTFDLEDVLRHGAVKLLIARVQSAEPQYVPDMRHARVMAAVCRRLDGIPLAIELAAARVAAFGIEGVAARLDDRFRLLVGGNRTALPRHQTLRATLDWSYTLLSDAEGLVLRRLSIFAGSFTLATASAVIADQAIAEADVIESISSLVAKSLVSADIADAVMHFHLLESTRAYAREKLTESGEFQQFCKRHAEHIRDIFERAEAETETTAVTKWVATYGHQIDDVRSALDWALSPSGDGAIGVALTIAAVPLWLRLSLVEECRWRVERALASHMAGQTANWEMRLYAALGASLLYANADSSAINAALTRALDIAEKLSDSDYRSRSLYGLWFGCLNNGKLRDSLALAKRFKKAAASSADPADVSLGERMIGNSLLFLGDVTHARRHIELMLGQYVPPVGGAHTTRFLVDQQTAARMLLAQVLWLQGFPDQAMRTADSNVIDARSVDHVHSACLALGMAACPIALFVGDLAVASRYVAMLLDVSGRTAMDMWRALTEAFQGILLVKSGNDPSGLQVLRNGFQRLSQTRFALPLIAILGEYARAVGRAGDVADGLATIDSALAQCERSEARWCFAELLRIKGELVLQEAKSTSATTAENFFVQGLDLAHRQGALSWELRCATSLALLKREQGRFIEARNVLEPVYGRFTEGFGTTDLVAARELMNTLGG